MDPIRHILLPVDGSEGATEAARVAARLARITGSEITLLYVFDAPALAVLGIAATGGLTSAKEAVAEGAFVPVRKILQDNLLEARECVDIGEPWARIVEFADRHEVDLIVMGRRGRSPLRQLLLGSVSERVASHAPCPVTITHP